MAIEDTIGTISDTSSDSSSDSDSDSGSSSSSSTSSNKGAPARTNGWFYFMNSIRDTTYIRSLFLFTLLTDIFEKAAYVIESYAIISSHNRSIYFRVENFDMNGG